MLKSYLRFLDLKAIEVLLLARGVKSFHGFNLLLDESRTERRLILDGIYELYRLLGGPFPQTRQKSLMSLFPTEKDPRVKMDCDEFSILNQFGGLSSHDSELKKGFASAFWGARQAGLGHRIDVCLAKLKESHEHARISLNCAVEAYATIFCYKRHWPDAQKWEQIKNSHRACKDLIFWRLANETYGLNREAMREAYERSAQSIPAGEDLLEHFHKTHADIMLGILGGPEKSGVQITPFAAQIQARHQCKDGRPDSGLPDSQVVTEFSPSTYDPCKDLATDRLLHDSGAAQDAASCELQLAQAGSHTPACTVSGTLEFVDSNLSLVEQPKDQVPLEVAELNNRVNRLEQFLEDNVIELLLENVQLRMHQVLDEQMTAQSE